MMISIGCLRINGASFLHAIFPYFKSTICCKFQISTMISNVFPHQDSTRKLYIDMHLEEIRNALSTLETFPWVTAKDRKII